jgi:hypothetical protein
MFKINSYDRAFGEHGMTVREFYAGCALVGLLADTETEWVGDGLVEFAVQNVDDLIDALNRIPPK